MPDILRQNVRCDSTGLDIVSPIDRMPPGAYPYLQNVRITQEGRFDARPGYTKHNSTPASSQLLHSIRRLNNVAGDTSVTSPYIYVVGDGTHLETGDTLFTTIDTGYSGKPLSLIPFKPEGSVGPWMYVYDENKLSKVAGDGTSVRTVGVVPPTTAPVIDYGTPAAVDVTTGQAIAGWVFGGAATALSNFDRTNAGAFTISQIKYNSGTTGWACIVPSAGNYFWVGERMQIDLGGTERVTVREIHPAITSTTIQSILYDSGTTGACSIVLTGSPGLTRNSLISIAGAETCRVLEYNLSPDGTTSSIRTVTTGARAAGNAVAGLISWYTYTTLNHTAGEAITERTNGVSQPAAGAGTALLAAGINASAANGRPIDPANDYLHISLFLQNPQFVTNLQLLLSLDTTPNYSFTNPGNSYIFTVPASDIDTGGSSGNAYAEIVIPMADGVRSGSDLTRTLASITGIGLQLTTTAACAWGFDGWYLFGTYGPDTATNSPVGISYECRYRVSGTGSASIPGPHTRYALTPQREAITVLPPAIATFSTYGIDQIDIYREGDTIPSFVYVGSVANTIGSPVTFIDTQPDTSIAANPAPNLTLLQPWPVLGPPWTGFVNTSGTSVQWVSGTVFNTTLLSDSVITINGIAYQTDGPPHSTTRLELYLSAGAQTNVPYSITSPTLAGQALPYAFGPLEGPYLPVVFALGDDLNAGTLYYTNNADLDSAADTNTLDLCSPSEPLVSGEVWNGLAIVGSRDNLYLVRYSFQTTPFQFSRMPTPSGMWSRWSCARGPDGVYFLGRDGIYRATDSSVDSITDKKLYSIFPHDGVVATGTPDLLPVDMQQRERLRLRCLGTDIYFDYLDSAGASRTLRYETGKQRWLAHTYRNAMTTHYLDEPLVTTDDTHILLLGASNGYVYDAGGNTDDTLTVQTVVVTPSLDGGDERAQKLPVDLILDADQSGSIRSDIYYDNGTVTGPSVTFTISSTRALYIQNISSLSTLTLSRNISLRLSWSGGPAGPRLYAFEPAQYVQPYLSKKIVTQYINLSFPGWKHHRRLHAGLISNATVNFTIKTQDGRTFGPYTIPSTSGQFRILPMMIAQACKDLAFAYELDGGTTPFALFPEAFTLETKDWIEPSYIELAVFKT
jgi:hypothetical protein